MAGPLADYAFINAKLKGRISKLMPEDAIERLARSADLSTALALLAGGPYGFAAEVYGRTGDLMAVEREFFAREVGDLLGIRRYLQGAALGFLDALLARYEVEVLKGALRLWFDRVIRGRPVEEASAYLHREPIRVALPLDRLLAASDIQEAATALESTPYAAPVRAGAEGPSNGTLFPVEIELDRWFYAQLTAAAAALRARDREIAERMVGVEIDLQNVAWVVRLKGSYDLPAEEALATMISGGRTIGAAAVASAYETGRITDLVSALVGRLYPTLRVLLSGPTADEYARLELVERALQAIMLHEASRMLGGHPFTVGVLLAYAVLAGGERRAVMTVLNAKFYRLPAERIRAGL